MLVELSLIDIKSPDLSYMSALVHEEDVSVEGLKGIVWNFTLVVAQHDKSAGGEEPINHLCGMDRLQKLYVPREGSLSHLMDFFMASEIPCKVARTPRMP
jgi:hypothetical protein